MERPGLGLAPNLMEWLDQDGRLAKDVACLRCGYNLRTLRAEGNCPECGAPVAVSFGPQRWRIDQRNWLRALVRGLDLVCVGVALIPAGVAAAYFLSDYRRVYSFDMVPTLVLAAIALAGGLIGWGFWKITKPPPTLGAGAAIADDRRTIRLAARRAGLAGCVLVPLAAPMGLLLGSESVLALAFWGGLLALTIGASAVSAYGRWVALEMDSDAWDLASSLSSLAVGYGLLAGGIALAVPLVFYTAGLSRPQSNGLGAIIGLASCLPAAVGGITLVATPFLAISLRLFLARHARLADEEIGGLGKP